MCFRSQSNQSSSDYNSFSPSASDSFNDSLVCKAFAMLPGLRCDSTTHVGSCPIIREVFFSYILPNIPQFSDSQRPLLPVPVARKMHFSMDFKPYSVALFCGVGFTLGMKNKERAQIKHPHPHPLQSTGEPFSQFLWPWRGSICWCLDAPPQLPHLSSAAPWGGLTQARPGKEGEKQQTSGISPHILLLSEASFTGLLIRKMFCVWWWWCGAGVSLLTPVVFPLFRLLVSHESKLRHEGGRNTGNLPALAVLPVLTSLLGLTAVVYFSESLSSCLLSSVQGLAFQSVG